jgi:hypothetical protein
MPRRGRWPYPQGDNSPDLRRPWAERQYRSYWTARDEWIMTGSYDALAAMEDFVEDLPLGAEFRDS